MNLIELKKKRFLYLQKLYEESGGSSNAVFDMEEVGNELGFEYTLTSNVVDYLINEGLIEPYAMGGSINITHWGIKEVEEAIENPSESTEHFAPINTYNINIHSSGEGNIINTGNSNVISLSNNVNQDDATNKINQIIATLQENEDIQQTLKEDAINAFKELLIEIKARKPSTSIIQKVLTYGSSIAASAL